MRSLSQSNLRIPSLVCLAAALAFSACDQPNPSTPATQSTPTPTPQAVVDFSTLSPSAPTPAPPAERKLTRTDEPKEDPAALAKRFRASDDIQERGEIVDELWSLDTPAAVETIRQLFLTEREADVKIDMIAGLTDSKNPKTREARFGLVVAGLTPGQPKDVREIAAQMLIELEDPRAITLLQQFSHDADPDIRETAREALETRKEAEQQ